MNRMTIDILIDDKNNGKVEMFFNGNRMNEVTEMDIKINKRTGKLEIFGKRFKYDRCGQFYVDEETKDTAIEEINYMNYFNETFKCREFINSIEKSIEFEMKNIHDTSLVNCKKMIQENLTLN